MRDLSVLFRDESHRVYKKRVVVGTGNNATRLEHELSSAIKLMRSKLKRYSRKHSETGVLLPSMVYFHLSWKKSISI
jgi:hypothetical protein